LSDRTGEGESSVSFPTDAELTPIMRIAIEEARESLREGNHGFGAVIVRDGKILARSHDTEETDADPTAHAELRAIREAASHVGKDLSSCMLVCTHEPCPMCAAAIVWSKIPALVYGYSIAEAMRQGRTRMDLECREIFRRAPADVQLHAGLLREECALLYDRDVRAEIKRLRGATDDQLRLFGEETLKKRLAWYRSAQPVKGIQEADPLVRAYRVLLLRLAVREDEAPIVRRTDTQLVFHSMNGCPTLEACKLLGLDTRRVCRLSSEGSTTELIRQVDRRLTFARNYEALRPYSPYCEEIIRYSRP
jgi:tRNA(adenine34) deaminase